MQAKCMQTVGMAQISPLYTNNLSRKVHTATYLFWSIVLNYNNIMDMHMYKLLHTSTHEHQTPANI